MKKVRNIILIPLGVIVSLNILVAILLNIPFIQQKILHIVVSELQKKTNSKITVGHFRLDLLRGVSLDDIYLADQKGDTLLYAGSLSANTSLFRAYRNNTLTIDAVLLEDFKVYLSKDSTNSPFNFQFLINAFSKEKTKVDTVPSLFDLAIGNIELRNGEVQYDVHSKEETPGLFNASHIHAKNLNGRFSLGSIRPEKFSAEIFRLSVKEASGLDLRNLKVQILNDQKRIRLSGFRMDLPNSSLNLSDVWLDYQNVYPDDLSFMRNGIYHIQIDESEIVPEDLQCFLPSLAGLSLSLKLTGELNDTIPSLGIKKLEALYDKDVKLSLSFSMSDWNNYQKSHYATTISQLFLSPKGVEMFWQAASPRTKLPDMVRGLGNLQLQMDAKGKLGDLLMNGNIEAGPDTLSIKGSLGYMPEKKDFSAKVDVLTQSFDLSAILDSSLHVGKAGFNLHADISIPEAREPDIRISGGIPFFTYRDYVYRQIELNGTYQGMHNMNAQLALNDDNISLRLEGRAQQSGKNLPEYELHTSIRHLNPYNLHLTNDFKDSRIETDIHLKIWGDKPENLLGYTRLDNLYFETDSAIIRMDSILLSIDKTANNENLLRLISPYLNLQVKGVYNPATIAQTAQNMLHHYLPTLFTSTNIPKNASPNNFIFSATLENMEELSTIFHIPIILNEKSSIQGTFRDASDEIMLHASLPNFSYGKIPMKGTTVFIGKKENMYVLDARSDMGVQDPVNVKLHAEIAKDTVLISLNYDNAPADFPISGDIKTFLTFRRKNPQSDLIMIARFRPSDLTVKDLHIELEPAIVTMKPGNIRINRFRLVQNNQLFFGINGTISASEKDTLQVSFKNASIRNLLGGVNLLTAPVDGYLDGIIYFSGLLGKPRFHTNSFKVNNITYAKDTIGSLTLDSRWNEKQQGMNVRASLFRSKEDISTAGGFISPVKDLVQFDVNLQQLPVEISQPFLKGTVHNLSGYFGANMKVNGKLSSPDIVGYAYLKDVSATVDYTDVTYRVSDTIRFTPAAMTVKNMMIYDDKRQSARFNCSIKHKRFSDISYSGSIQMNNFLLVNNPEKTDSLFYGTFYANGNLTVRGDLKTATISGNLGNGDNTNLKIRLPESAAQAKAYHSIVYLNKETNYFRIKKNPVKRDFLIKSNVAVEISEEAKFGLIINPATGDELSIRGNGSLHAKYDSELSGIKLFGHYIVDNGSLKIKLSQLPSKTFIIRQGSRVNLNGDPQTGNFDITATYRARAGLNTLDPSFASLGLSSTKVSVDCILHIQGNLNRMNLSYEITLPDASDDVNRMVSSIINTDDLRIREFAYLVAFNSFFPPNNQLFTGNSSVVSSLASSSLSSVLNGVLSGALGNGWVIGTEVHASSEDFSDLEMSLSLSKQLFNERLIFNTNVGYRNASAVNESPWIGDFDLEYKLTKSGMVRAKAYNHTNNEIFRSSNTIQGVGLVFTKEGKKFKDLFRSGKKKDTEIQMTNKRDHNPRDGMHPVSTTE